MTAAQKAAARPKCKKLLTEYKKLDFVLDDESYFTLSNSDQPGNDIYYSSDKNKKPERVKRKLEAKFEPKLVVWICISPKGVSKQSVFAVSGNAVNQDIYLEDMIKGRLIPFIKSHYNLNQVNTCFGQIWRVHITPKKSLNT
jgi:hypothetical protein